MSRFEQVETSVPTVRPPYAHAAIHREKGIFSNRQRTVSPLRTQRFVNELRDQGAHCAQAAQDPASAEDDAIAGEAAVIADVAELIGEGVVREVDDRDWIRLEVIDRGVERGFVVRPGECAEPVHSPAWLDTENGRVCGWCHRKVDPEARSLRVLEHS